MTVANQCDRCGAAFFAAATPEGLCPHCLFDIPESMVLLPADPGEAAGRTALASTQGSHRLLKGTWLGRYEVMSSLGEGGMGEVYQARDARLGRSVAIKVLPSAVSTDAKLRRRLEREAQLVSHINHPHVCALFDVGEENGIVFLVMEYLEGETLLERLRRGPLPFDQVLQYAIEIADALDEAHRHGVIHRDLKPSNIMLTASGAKLFDFGLAKLHLGEPTGLLSGVPFTSDHRELSGERTLVGTLQYMSPEQLEGRVADPRSDLFALGLVLYEMATGQLAFHGEREARLLVGQPSPDVTALSLLRDVPPSFEQLVDTCLARNPEERWQTAKDIVLQLRWLQRHAAVQTQTTKQPRRVPAWLPWAVAALIIAVGAGRWVFVHVPASTTEVIRFSLAPPAQSAFATISPDGRSVVWLGQDRTHTHLWLQTLDSLTATLLDDTEGAQAPFWSPDSRSVGFFAGGDLKRIAVSVGPPVRMAAAPFGLGGTWNRDGTIVFAPDKSGGLYRVSPGGGPAVALTAPNPAEGETSHRWPSFLPDGRRFLYLAIGTGRESGVIHVGSLDSAGGPVLGHADSGAVYAPGGYMLFGLKGTLMAQAFDVRSLQTRDDPVTVARRPALDLTDRSAYFSASETGVLVYHDSTVPESRLVWFDRTGRLVDSLLPTAQYGDPSISPDATSAAFVRYDIDKQISDIWRIDLVHGGLSRVTNSNTYAMRPVWSPRADELIYAMKRNLAIEMYRTAPNGGPEQLVQRSVTNQTATDWRRDGKVVLYENYDPKTKSDLWLLPQEGNQTPVPYLRTPFNETRGKFSPDGRWISYTSDESGTSDVYIQSVPTSGRKWLVSIRGGSQCLWRHDGKELFYLAPDRWVMAVPVRATSTTLELGPATPIFQIPDGVTTGRYKYDVSPDGQRFLVNVAAKEGAIQPLSATVVVNWVASVQR